MPNSLIKLFFAFVIVVLAQVSVYSKTASDKEFVRVNEELGIKLIASPAYVQSDDFSKVPEGLKFTELENSQSRWLPVEQSSPHWIRVIFENSSDTVKKLILKTGQFPSDLHIYFRDSGEQWISKRIGILVPKDYSLNSFFPACEIEFRPGIDTIYVYNADTWGKFQLGFIRITDKDSLRFDRSDFLTASGNFVFYLYAFTCLLAFQIIYVILQSFYHRKKEYREYLFYLLTLFIYFLIRYEIYFDSNILTGSYPYLRRLLNDLMLLLPFGFYLRFARYYIDMPLKYPAMNRNVIIAERIAFILSFFFVVMWFIGLRDFGPIYYQVVVILFSLYSLRLVLFFIKQRNRQIGFLLAGSVAALAGNFLGMTFSAFPLVISAVEIAPLIFTMTGLMFEIFFFNTGLGYKAKVEQEEKIKAQETLIDQLKTNRRMQDRLESMRNRIASDLHDDVGSTLSSIGLYSEVGMDQIDVNPTYTKGILEKISASSQRMMTAMNDIVWAIHSRHDSGEGLIERIRQFADERLGPAGIKFHLSHDQFVDELKLSMEARRNILLIFKEAINNAAKYSESNEIRCNITVADDWLECRITDYGKGMNGGGNHTGNGLMTMKNRASEMKGRLDIIPGKDGGTVIIATFLLKEITLG